MEAQFDRYLVQVEGGEELIEERNRELARAQARLAADSEAERMKRLEQSGEAKPGSGKLGRDFWNLPLPKDPNDSVRQALGEDRG